MGLYPAKLARQDAEAVAKRLAAIPRVVTEAPKVVVVKAGETVTAEQSSLLIPADRVAEVVAKAESADKAIKKKSGLDAKLREQGLALAAAKRKSRAWRNRTGLALIVCFGIGYAVAK